VVPGSPGSSEHTSRENCCPGFGGDRIARSDETVHGNAELARIWQVGLENLSALSPEDQSRFFHATYQFLKAFETIHTHYVYGLLDLELWQGWRELLRHYIVAPGMAHYWQLRRDLFSERFQKFVQTLEEPEKHFTVGRLLDEKIDK